MKILLLIPPVVYRRQPSIGLAYLSAYLRMQGYAVKVWDLNIEISGINDGDDGHWGQSSNAELFIEENKPLFDKWVDRIFEYGPDIIGFNVWSTSKIQCLYLAQKIKDRDPGKLIVFGGAEAMLADKLFWGKQCVDILVKGEGERVFTEIIKEYERHGKVDFCQGCYVRRAGEGMMTDCGERPEIGNLDELPFPDFSDFSLNDYLFNEYMPISFSRGCKWRCSFCTVHNCWNVYRSRSAANIYAEIKKRIADFTVTKFVVCDAALNQDLNMLSELCDMIIADNLKIKWEGMAQINPGMNQEFLRKMKRAGCALLNYGVESGVQSILESMGKKYRVEDAQQIIKDSHEAGIDVVLNFIVGYPGETEQDFYGNLDFIKSIRKYVLNIAPGHPCLVVPYNRLFRYPEKYGLIFNEKDPYNWETADGNNNAEERERRVRIFNDFLNNYEIQIRCGDDDRQIIEKENETNEA